MTSNNTDDDINRMDESPLRVGDLDFDRHRQTVRRHGALLDIPDLSFRLFEALIDHAPDRVGKDELIREIWGDVVVGDETLAQRVRLLRQALGDDSQAPRYIASVRGRGYRLICSVAPADASESRAASRSFWPIGVATIALAAGAWWFAGQEAEMDIPVIRAGALAVLPFQDMSAAGDHQFFADGMHEELLSRLALIDNIAVISRTSVEKYRDSNVSLPEIATELGARTIIEGSVRAEDNRLRITVQLIDAESDEHIWAESYDRELSLQNIFPIQQEVAERIARALEVEYAATDLSLIALPTNDLEAYNLYLLGRYHTFKQTPDDLERAIVYLENATMLDNQFAEAYATLGWAYSFLGTGYGHQLPDDVYPKAKAAALRAIALDGELADARSLYADILTWYDWDIDAAEREYLKTIELDPVNTLGYALYLSTQQRHDEAIAAVERRIAANPNDPYVQVNAGWRYLNAGLYKKAILAARKGDLHDDAPIVVALSYIATGDTDKAIEIFEANVRQRGRDPRQLANLAFAYFHAGRNADGYVLLNELLTETESQRITPALLAAVYFAAGDADSGFALLEQAFEQRSRAMIFLQVNQMLVGYRDDSRYQNLIEKIGF